MKSIFTPSVLSALGIAVLVSLWLVSGLINEPSRAQAPSEAPEPEPDLVQVLVESRSAEDHAKIIRVFGQTAPDRDVTLKAQTEGTIAEVLIEKGAQVQKGDLIARLAMDDRESQRKSAVALVRQRQLEFEASERLSEKSFRSRTQLAEAQARLDDARAQLQAILLDITHTEIRSPFDAILEDRPIEVGDFVREGDELAHLMDLDPVLITAEISEQDVLLIEPGQSAQARLSNNRLLDTQVRFIATSSDRQTRTYQIDVEAPNPGHDIQSGLTAQLRLKVGTNRAYLISPSILTLSQTGTVGLKTVNSDDQVVFHPVQLLEDTAQGIWVSGVPVNARIIVRGQDYILPGQTVRPVEKAPSQPFIAKVPS